jgi:5-methyltetrahydropteroyltriglutamate--homocysteine methyltransferase
VGVINPIDSTIETPDVVRERILEAASILPVAQLGTTDDCGFAPFADDTSTARDVAFGKIRARVEGTLLAARELA